MDIGEDAQLLAAVRAFTGSRDSGEVLSDLYRLRPSGREETFSALADLLPIEQISAVRLVDRLNLSGLPAVVLLLAMLRRLRTEDAWVHYNLAKHLGALCGAGVSAAKLPAIVHSLLACEGLKDTASAQPLPLGVLARELAGFAPREAIRRGMVAARHGDPAALPRLASAFAALGLEEIKERASVGQVLQTAKELRLSAADIPDLPQTTRLDEAAGLRAVTIQPPRQITFPSVRGDAGHYIFAAAEQSVQLPGITVHALEGGTFSIDATMRGLERHYVFDRNGDCLLELANGSAPFVADAVIECDVPVAILDDRFSGVLNICHFLLDRVTRIPLYEQAWARPGKFFLVDDHPYCRDIFARLGLADRVIIPPSRRVAVRAPELLFSSNIAADFRHPAHFCADWAIGYLRHALRVGERPARPGRKLMISRADTTGRGIINWDEVRPVFERRGFEIVELSRLSTAGQMALFGDASQVVGVHGAGLTNILFAPRSCAVLEILPPLLAVHDYWLLAAALGQTYRALIAEDPEFPRPDYRTWQHRDVYGQRDVVVPVERLEAALMALEAEALGSSAISRSDTDQYAPIDRGGASGEAPVGPDIAQLAARDVPLVNVALHKPAMQSSDSGHRCPDKRVGGNATSGVKTGGFGFHTDIEPNPWWMVDLQRVYEIHRVVAYNRETAAPERADTMSVYLGLEPDGPWREIHRCHGRFGGILSNTPLVVSLDTPIPARYVRLQLNTTEFFHLDEVEVYAIPAPDGLHSARITEVFGSQGAIPAGQKQADSNLVNSEGWSWAAFCSRYRLDPTAIRREWSGRRLRFDFDPGTPFDGEIGALRVEPVGGIGNVFYDVVNACLIARAMHCTALEVPDIEGVRCGLPVDVDGLRIERAGSSGSDRPTLSGSFYWPIGFEPLLGQYSTEFLVDTIERFVSPIFAGLPRAGGTLGDDVLVLHFRGGDIFQPGGTHAWYVQPPASFYKRAIALALTQLGVASVRMVYQDRSNPCVDLVEAFLKMHGIPYAAQSSSVFNDAATLLSARHLVAGYGTFCELAAMLSRRLATYIGFRTIETQTEIKFWAEDRLEDVLRARGVRMLVVADRDGAYIPPATWANTPEQKELMRTFPDAQLELVEGSSSSVP